MKLEDRLRQSIKHRPGTVVLRTEVAGLGSPSQLTFALNALQRDGDLVRLDRGIYAKTQRGHTASKSRPQGNLETIIQEVIQKLGMALHEPDLSKALASADKNALVVELDTPRIARKLHVDGKVIQLRSYRRKLHSAKTKALTIPTEGVADFVQGLARKHKVVYSSNSIDQWAEAVTRLAGDAAHTDSTQDLLVALKRAGKISKKDVADLTISHLRERQKRVRSI